MKLSESLKEDLRKLLLGVHKRLCPEVLVLGDSHATIFGHKILRLHLRRYYLNVSSVPGATASGLENPESVTQAAQKFDLALSSTRAQKVIVMLGENDTGFIIWYRADKYKIPVREAFQKTVATYGHFIRDVRARGFSPICVSTPLPTIQDGADWGEVANLRKGITATQRQRTELTLAFNREMERLCRAEGIPYLNLDRVSVGEDGLVKPELLNSDPADHHYGKRAFARLLAEHIDRVLEDADPVPSGSGRRAGRARGQVSTTLRRAENHRNSPLSPPGSKLPVQRSDGPR